MKRMDFFCASPASTAICSSLDQRSMVRRSHRAATAAVGHQSPSRLHHHHDHHGRRSSGQQQPHHHHVPCSSKLPINPRPYNNYHDDQKSRKSISFSNNNKKETSDQLRRKSSADIYDMKSPHGSSRYLLSDGSPFIDWFSETTNDDQLHVVPARPPRAVVPAEPAAKFRSLGSNDSKSALVRASSSTRSRHQVVVLRVSLHCKGCEGKVRKHLSKMEGVTSFSIDLAEKKVTVIGDVTPLGVLASVSKVKNAQLWPSATTSSSSPWSA